jgi:NAD(P)-dependent dehydrogenase (short-subunit alcohol dehydrogenase family)
MTTNNHASAESVDAAIERILREHGLDPALFNAAGLRDSYEQVVKWSAEILAFPLTESDQHTSNKPGSKPNL